MSLAKLDKLEELAIAATPGPWRRTYEDLQFMVAADRDTILNLIAVVRAALELHPTLTRSQYAIIDPALSALLNEPGDDK